MTPPPTTMTRALEGTSIATLTSHPGVVGIERRGRERCRSAPLALDQHIESAPRCGEFLSDACERKALLDPMSIGARGGHTDTAIAGEDGLAAARIRVGRLDLRINDLEWPRGLPQRCRLADKIRFVDIDEARHVRFRHG